MNNATPGNHAGPADRDGRWRDQRALDQPGQNSNFADRVNQLDLRLTKGFRVGRYRLDALVDYYNAFNVSPVQTYTTTYSAASWLAPTGILQSAYVKLGGRFMF